MNNRSGRGVSDESLIRLSDIDIKRILRRISNPNNIKLGLLLLKRVRILDDRNCWVLSSDWSHYARVNKTPAHRLSYKLFVGHISGANLVCHHCDRKGCINFEHLFQGTYTDNNYDWMIKKKAYLINREKDISDLRVRTGNYQDPNKVIDSWWDIATGRLIKDPEDEADGDSLEVDVEEMDNEDYEEE